jgi:nucleotide-binding universal stress UspA family protein
VAPLGYSVYDEVLLATDGSEPSSRAAKHAIEQACAFEARLHVLHAVSPRVFDVFSSDDVKGAIDEATERGQRLVGEVEEDARSEGLEVVTHVEQRAPHKAIAGYAEENNIDLVVMGSRGRSDKSIGDRLLGGVSSKVIHTSDAPVLTVH